jgi:hypothetical protein
MIRRLKASCWRFRSVGSAFAQDGHEWLASVGASDIAPRELLSGRH